ncbi:MAG: ribonuclease Z [Methanococcoides sp.]|nr:ribonuclease Z [Methanococcoides sp.]MCD4807578.1 ribonuclease Z [Methanococcoides sp.]
MLKVTFLGTGGSLPTTNRNPSAIMVNRDGELLMFDCGEGAQQQMMRAKTGMMNLSSIFITHFHADHILGIPGLVQTMSFQGRTEPLTIYGPEWVEEFIKFLTAMGYYKLKFEINAVRLKSGESIKRDGYSIVALKTEHNVPSIGYALVEDERPGRFDRDKAIELGVPVGPLFSKLHHGGSVEVAGRVISAEDVVGEPRPGRTIVYSGDTRPCLGVLKASDGADLLIHDSTLADNMIDWAKESMHSTAGEAAALAKKAGAKKLVLTHLSSRYSDDATPLLNDAKALFEDVILAEDLLVIEVPLSDD